MTPPLDLRNSRKSRSIKPLKNPNPKLPATPKLKEVLMFCGGGRWGCVLIFIWTPAEVGEVTEILNGAVLFMLFFGQLG